MYLLFVDLAAERSYIQRHVAFAAIGTGLVRRLLVADVALLRRWFVAPA